MRAFGDFRDVLAGEMASAMPELRGDVERVLEATGGKSLSVAVTTTTADGNTSNGADGKMDMGAVIDGEGVAGSAAAQAAGPNSG